MARLLYKAGAETLRFRFRTPKIAAIFFVSAISALSFHFKEKKKDKERKDRVVISLWPLLQELAIFALCDLKTQRFFCDLRQLQTLVLSQKYCQTKWAAYCCTNTRRIAIQIGGVLRASLSSRLRGQEGTAIQMGGILPCKLEVCCSTFSETSKGWGF